MFIEGKLAKPLSRCSHIGLVCLKLGRESADVDELSTNHDLRFPRGTDKTCSFKSEAYPSPSNAICIIVAETPLGDHPVSVASP